MEALAAEIERNLEIASSTKSLLDRERDMLQGGTRERLLLHRFHTDVWDSRVNRGDDALEAAGAIAQCYMDLKEVNEIVAWFNDHGNNVAYVPVLERGVEDYGRDEILSIIRERCDQAEIRLRDARDALGGLDL